MDIVEFYSNLCSTDTPQYDVSDIEDTSMLRAEIQRIADLEDHRVYQLMEVDKLINTIKQCGIDRSMLYLYNQNNELSRISGVALPSIEEFDSGYRISGATVDRMVANMQQHANIIGMEGNMFGDYFRAWYDDFLKSFRAGWRWFQSMSSQPTKLAGRIESYVENLKSNSRSKLSGSAELIAANTLKRHFTNKTTEYRREANNILKNMNSGNVDLSEAVDNADRLRDMRDKIRSDIKDIKGSIGGSNRKTTDLSRISVSDYIRLGEQAIERCKSIAKMNEDYDGFWYTGYSSGKLHYLSNVLPSLIPDPTSAFVINGITYSASVMVHRGIISSASVGWQVLTLTVDADMLLIREVAHSLKTISDSIH